MKACEHPTEGWWVRPQSGATSPARPPPRPRIHVGEKGVPGAHCGGMEDGYWGSGMCELCLSGLLGGRAGPWHRAALQPGQEPACDRSCLRAAWMRDSHVGSLGFTAEGAARPCTTAFPPAFLPEATQDL